MRRLFKQDYANNAGYRLVDEDGGVYDAQRIETRLQSNRIRNKPPEYEIIDNRISPRVEPESTRMAGDLLSQSADDVIAELRGERDDAIVQNAMDDLYSLREIDKDVNERWSGAAQLAGTSPDNMGNPQLVGNITRDIPQALVVNYADTSYLGKPVRNETRFHTKLQQNPVTGQPDVVPLVARGENQPLITEFGMVGNGLHSAATEGMHSDEFLGKRVAQLMGLEPEATNTVRKTDVDLKDNLSGALIDVEILKKDNFKREGAGMQVYTQVAPPSLTGNYVRDRKQSEQVAGQMVKEMRPLIEKRMKSQNLSMVEAVESLADEGALTNAYGNARPYGGKLLKNEGGYADSILYPELSNSDAYRNNQTTQFKGDTRKLVMPLEGAYYGDVRTAQDTVASLRGAEAVSRMSVRPLPGNDGKTPGGKVYLQVPEGSRGLTDLARSNPAVRQLFRDQ